MVRNVRHFGIVVRDMDACLKFYRDLLGLQVRNDAVESGETMDAVLGLKDVQVRTVKMGAGESGALVELLEFRSPREKARAPGRLCSAGPRHLALTVEHLDRLYRALSAQGIRCLSEPRPSPDGSVRLAFCLDPEGNPVELVETVTD